MRKGVCHAWIGDGFDTVALGMRLLNIRITASLRAGFMIDKKVLVLECLSVC